MPNINTLMQLARQAEGQRVGYDQAQRWSWLDTAQRRIVPDRETDCSALTMGLYWLAGWPVNISGTCYTGNAEKLARDAGFQVIPVRGKSGNEIAREAQPGDAVLGPGHIVLVMDDGTWLSAENDERGRSTGGQAGDQTGREVRFRGPYTRSKGWDVVLRPPADAVELVDRPTVQPSTALVVDGELGPRTITALQKWVGAVPDGVWGPATTRAIQAKVGVKVDGEFGKNSVRALQAAIGANGQSNRWGPNSTRALQVFLNNLGGEVL